MTHLARKIGETLSAGTIATNEVEIDWTWEEGPDPKILAIRKLGPDGWEPFPKRMMKFLTEDQDFLSDLRLLIAEPQGLEEERDPEPDPSPW